LAPAQKQSVKSTCEICTALAGFGLAYVPEEVARPHMARGRFRRVLEDWC